MHSITEHKSLWMGLALSVLLFIFQFLPRMVKQTPTYPMPTAVTPRASAFPVAKAPEAPKPVVVRQVAVTRELTGLALRSSLKDYLLTFSGRVRCDGAACMSSLELLINTGSDVEIRQTVSVASDGAFAIQVPLRAELHEQIDWKLTATGGDMQIGSTHGRRILREEPNLTIDASLDLH